MTVLSDALSATLDVLAEAAEGLEEPWWLFGGAAMALVGVEGLEPADVDVLTGLADAPRLLDRLGAGLQPGAPSGRFRSQAFGQAASTPLKIEVMAGFCVEAEGAWRPVRFETRLAVPWRGRRLYVPEIAEQIATCRLFGRPKDLERAAQLAALA
jgi:hypothetical protein